MNRLLLDIRDFHVGAFVMDGDKTCYETTLDCRSFIDATVAGKELESVESILHTTDARGSVLSSILTKINRDAGVTIHAGYLLIPDTHILQETVVLPKLSPLDAHTLIERKLNPQGNIKLNISPAEESDRKQTWDVDYLPIELTRKYQKAFSVAGIKLQGITTSCHTVVNAIVKCFPVLVDNGHILFDLSTSTIEGFYVIGNRVCRHEQFPLVDTEASHEGESAEQSQERALFRVIDGIFRIMNSLESGSHAEMINLLLCGNHPQLLAIAAELTEVTGLKVLTANMDQPLYPPGAHALLSGYADALINGADIDYLQHEHLQQKALSIKSGIYIYLLTALLVIASIVAGEVHHKMLLSELATERKKLTSLRSSSAIPLKQAELISELQKGNNENGSYYGVFRDLANNLPDGISISAINIKRNEGNQLLELQAQMRQSSLHADKILSRLDQYLSSSEIFVMHNEPVITIIGSDQDKAVQMKFNCELVLK